MALRIGPEVTVRASKAPFLSYSAVRPSAFCGVGPAWLTIASDRVLADAPLSWGLLAFAEAAVKMTWPGRYAYGTVYATRLSGAARDAGEWHYDLGEYTADGAERFVSTYRSDGNEIGNVFRLPDGASVQAPNLHVTAFHEGSDYHRAPAVPLGAASTFGIFMSATLYRAGEPANLDCPRLAELRDRGPYADLARLHKNVVRTGY